MTVHQVTKESAATPVCSGTTAVIDGNMPGPPAVYPITPASTMGELADEWSAKGRANLWGALPEVVEIANPDLYQRVNYYQTLHSWVTSP